MGTVETSPGFRFGPLSREGHFICLWLLLFTIGLSLPIVMVTTLLAVNGGPADWAYFLGAVLPGLLIWGAISVAVVAVMVVFTFGGHVEKISQWKSRKVADASLDEILADQVRIMGAQKPTVFLTWLETGEVYTVSLGGKQDRWILVSRDLFDSLTDEEKEAMTAALAAKLASDETYTFLCASALGDVLAGTLLISVILALAGSSADVPGKTVMAVAFVALLAGCTIAFWYTTRSLLRLARRDTDRLLSRVLKDRAALDRVRKRVGEKPKKSEAPPAALHLNPPRPLWAGSYFLDP